MGTNKKVPKRPFERVPPFVLEMAQNGADPRSQCPSPGRGTPPEFRVFRAQKKGFNLSVSFPWRGALHRLRLGRGPGNGPERASSGIPVASASAGGLGTAENGPDPGSQSPPPRPGARKRPRMGPDPGSQSPPPRRGSWKRPKTRADPGSQSPPPRRGSWKRPKPGPIRDLSRLLLGRGPGNGPNRARSGFSVASVPAGGPETVQNGPDPGSQSPPPRRGSRKRLKTGQIRDLSRLRLGWGPGKTGNGRAPRNFRW